MFDSLAGATKLIEELVAGLDPALLAPEDALAGLDAFARAERLCAAGRVLCSGRVAEAGLHRDDGSRSAAHWLAQRTGQPVGEAVGALETARQLPSLGGLDAALRAGRLSAPQAAAVAEGAGADPSCERQLLRAAQHGPLKRLRERARELKAAVTPEAVLVERERQLHANRCLRTSTGRDGALRGEFALAPLAGARFLAAIEVEQRHAFEAARRRGEHEAAERYAADALVALCERPPGEGRCAARVVVTLDAAALRRGAPEAGETCRLAGAGPVSVATAESLLGEALLDVVVTNGVDVATVAHYGRTVPAALRTALAVRDPHCVVPGCGESRLLEVDHWRVPFAKGGPTSLDNLARVCRHHHRKKTHEGFVLDGGPGRWRWRPPRRSSSPPAAADWPGEVPDEVRDAAAPHEPPGHDDDLGPPADAALALALF